jgi:hypothetical protein
LVWHPGAVPDWSKHKSLFILDLSQNELTSLGAKMPRSVDIRLSYNKLKGTLPAKLSEETQILNLSNNNFTGKSCATKTTLFGSAAAAPPPPPTHTRARTPSSTAATHFPVSKMRVVYVISREV